MTDFWFYVFLGFDHVLDWRGNDHMLFLAVLVVGLMPKEWRKVLALVTMFTIGHMASLTYATLVGLDYNQAVIEFLIPLTILLTAIYKFVQVFKSKMPNKPLLLYVGTLFFGLIHGLGFASFFRTLDENTTLPLLEFALGIESAQIVIVLFVILAGVLATRILGLSNKIWTYIVCGIITVLLIPMLIETWPF